MYFAPKGVDLVRIEGGERVLLRCHTSELLARKDGRAALHNRKIVGDATVFIGKCERDLRASRDNELVEIELHARGNNLGSRWVCTCWPWVGLCAASKDGRLTDQQTEEGIENDVNDAARWAQ